MKKTVIECFTPKTISEASYEELVEQKKKIETELQGRLKTEHTKKIDDLLKAGVYNWEEGDRIVVPAQYWDKDMVHHQNAHTTTTDATTDNILSSKDYQAMVKKNYGTKAKQAVFTR